MKIGIMGTRGIPNRYGGFEQCAQFLAEGLVSKGHEVTVYNSSLHPYKENKLGAVSIIHCKEPGWLGTPGQFVYDRNCLRDAAGRNFDVLLHLGYTSDSLFHRLWPGKMAHIVNMDGLEWKRSKYGAITRRFLKKAESWAANHANVLVADSIGIQAYLQKAHNKPSVFIPYGAVPFTTPDLKVLDRYSVQPGGYGLTVARMEPENNIHMIIEAWLRSAIMFPLLIISNAGNKYGRRLQKKYQDPRIRFAGTVYEPDQINNLRYFSSIYFHGHSVGGTNPALLEAMACNCNIVAHDNIFNRSVLEEGARFFTDVNELSQVILNKEEAARVEERKNKNREKIRSIYNWDLVVDQYERLMLDAVHQKR